MSKEKLDLASVKVKLFASSRELVGENEVRISLADKTTVGNLRKKIVEMYPALSKITFVVAVNHKVSDDSAVINSSDEVAVLPPVSGG
ncbi:MAG: molybdopterin converting factor subunit 1 [Candidatus Nitrosomirales archaeon]|jgi:molybdopterin converting factor subunit 1